MGLTGLAVPGIVSMTKVAVGHGHLEFGRVVNVGDSQVLLKDESVFP